MQPTAPQKHTVHQGCCWPVYRPQPAAHAGGSVQPLNMEDPRQRTPPPCKSAMCIGCWLVMLDGSMPVATCAQHIAQMRSRDNKPARRHRTYKASPPEWTQPHPIARCLQTAMQQRTARATTDTIRTWRVQKLPYMHATGHALAMPTAVPPQHPRTTMLRRTPALKCAAATHIGLLSCCYHASPSPAEPQLLLDLCRDGRAAAGSCGRCAEWTRTPYPSS